MSSQTQVNLFHINAEVYGEPVVKETKGQHYKKAVFSFRQENYIGNLDELANDKTLVLRAVCYDEVAEYVERFGGREVKFFASGKILMNRWRNAEGRVLQYPIMFVTEIYFFPTDIINKFYAGGAWGVATGYSRERLKRERERALERLRLEMQRGGDAAAIREQTPPENMRLWGSRKYAQENPNAERSFVLDDSEEERMMAMKTAEMLSAGRGGNRFSGENAPARRETPDSLSEDADGEAVKAQQRNDVVVNPLSRGDDDSYSQNGGMFSI